MNATIMVLMLATCGQAGHFQSGEAKTAMMTVRRNIPYVQPRHDRQTLDVYLPADAKDLPVMIWIHGGGWRAGSKSNVQVKPQAFVDKGFIFVSVEYRLVPEVTVKEMAGDIAAAIKFVHARVGNHGGNPEQLFVAGHSAGAHLAALVCTDESYLQAQGLSLANIRGCIPVDTAAYDVNRQIESLGPLRARTYTTAFGTDETIRTDLSPIVHVKKAHDENQVGADSSSAEDKTKQKQMPAFLLLHVASREDSTQQSRDFAKVLTNAGCKAKVVGGENKTHASINRELGKPDDAVTQAVFKFLENLTTGKE